MTDKMTVLQNKNPSTLLVFIQYGLNRTARTELYYTQYCTTLVHIAAKNDNFVHSGHDTTSSGMGWTIWLLGQHPEYQVSLFCRVSYPHLSMKESQPSLQKIFIFHSLFRRKSTRKWTRCSAMMIGNPPMRISRNAYTWRSASRNHSGMKKNNHYVNRANSHAKIKHFF